MASSNCHGLRHDEEGAGYYCPIRNPEEPEDGDWDAFCEECRVTKALMEDRAIEAAMEEAGALT